MKIVFQQPIQDYSLRKLEEIMQEKPEFIVNESNINDFFDCDSILEMLKYNNIKYEIKLGNELKSSMGIRGIGYYNYTMLTILISEEDYEKIKDYFEVGDIPDELREETTDGDENYQSNTVAENFFSAIIIVLGIFLVAFGIDFILRKSKFDLYGTMIAVIIMIVIGAILILWRLKKIVKLVRDIHYKKSTKL